MKIPSVKCTYRVFPKHERAWIALAYDGMRGEYAARAVTLSFFGDHPFWIIELSPAFWSVTEAITGKRVARGETAEEALRRAAEKITVLFAGKENKRQRLNAFIKQHRPVMSLKSEGASLTIPKEEE